MDSQFVSYGKDYNAQAETFLGVSLRACPIITQNVYIRPFYIVRGMPWGRVVKITQGFAGDTFELFVSKAAWRLAQDAADGMLPDPETGRRPALYR